MTLIWEGGKGTFVGRIFKDGELPLRIQYRSLGTTVWKPIRRESYEGWIEAALLDLTREKWIHSSQESKQTVDSEALRHLRELCADADEAETDIGDAFAAAREFLKELTHEA